MSQPLRTHAHREGRFVAVVVEDTCSGIDPDKLDVIFEPFFTTKDVVVARSAKGDLGKTQGILTIRGSGL